MESIEWDESMALGVRDIDDEHRSLVDCYNRVFQAIFSRNEPAIVETALQTLLDHTRDHFLSEEALMEGIDYPGLATHRAEHQALLFSATMFQQGMLADGGKPISIQRLSFLRSWVLTHMMTTDRELARHLLRAGPQAAAPENQITAA